jgi:hypothetical protein
LHQDGGKGDGVPDLRFLHRFLLWRRRRRVFLLKFMLYISPRQLVIAKAGRPIYRPV